MKTSFKSIRWRLQLWYGAMLLTVLTAFGFAAYRLAWENRLRLVDRELQRAADGLFQAIGPGRERTNSIPQGDRPHPRELFQNASIPELDENYFALFLDGKEFRRSSNAPNGIAPPPQFPSGFSSRTRNQFRELLMVPNFGISIVVGRSITADVVDLRNQAFLMALAGATVAAVGLIGGGWIASQAIRPIQQISQTAAKIANGNLEERINVPDTQSELGQLATTLNNTFDRLRTAYDQLHAAFERQAEFTADASHELRTPVSVILAEANSALARERTTHEYKESMESVQRSARRMRHLTDSLLALARLDSNSQFDHSELCKVDRIAYDAIETLRPLAEQHKVRLSSELRAAAVTANPELIGQVFTNLIANAIHYNQPGGSVSIKVTTEGNFSVIAIIDDGLGIGKEDLPHIFERFYRADKSRSQSNGRIGLGLAITKAIVQAHRGVIEVSSILGEGTTFKVHLPK